MTTTAPDPGDFRAEPESWRRWCRDRAVSWPAIIAGAFVIAALSLMLLALGAGAGLSSLSPWAGSGATPAAVGIGALVWLAIVQVIASGIGGYLTGRLRPRWVAIHPHEMHFRDSAHGFLAWAVAMVVSAGWLTSAASTMSGARMTGAAATDNPAREYYVDQLFRAPPPTPLDTSRAVVATLVPVGADISPQSDAREILAHSLDARTLSPDDRDHLTRLVVNATGMTAAAATARVDQVFHGDQEALDQMRKAGAHLLYWLFVALLLGAFSASWIATIGGRHRETLHVWHPDSDTYRSL